MKQIVFLTYLNRSGSTYLAKLLDEYEEVGVTIEANIPDGFQYRQRPNILRDIFKVKKELTLKSERDVSHYLDELFSDPKFRHWGIERSILEKELAEKRGSLGFQDIMSVILDLYFIAPSIKIGVFKQGNYIFEVDFVRNVFPGCKFIFVLRDLRGIYSSQKRTMDTQRQMRMGFSPVNSAKKYNKVCRIVEKHRKEDYFCVVKYEDLLTNQEYELDRVLAFLGVRNKKKSRGEYWEKVPDDQKNIHSLIQSDPIKERIDAWKNSLSNYEVYLLQKKASRALSENGYDLIETAKIGMTDRAAMAGYWKRSFQNKMYWYCLWLKRVVKMGISNSSCEK